MQVSSAICCKNTATRRTTGLASPIEAALDSTRCASVRVDSFPAHLSPPNNSGALHIFEWAIKYGNKLMHARWPIEAVVVVVRVNE